MRLVAAENFRQAPELLHVVLLGHAGRLGIRICNPVIHCLHARGGRVSKPCDLDRGGLARENHQAIAAGMARNIHQDIDPVLFDQVRHGVVVQNANIVPMVAFFLYPFGHLVFHFRIRIDKNFELIGIAQVQQWLEEIMHGMGAKIRRNIADSQPSFGFQIADKFSVAQIRRGHFPEFFCLRHQFLRRDVGGINHHEQVIAVNVRPPGPGGNSFFINFCSLVEAAHILEGCALAVQRIRVSRFDCQGLLTTFHRLFIFRHEIVDAAQIVQDFRRQRRQFEGFPVVVNRALQHPLFEQEMGDVGVGVEALPDFCDVVEAFQRLVAQAFFA